MNDHAISMEGLRPDRRFITDQQLCALLHTDPRTTLRWRTKGGGPPFVRIGKRKILYRVCDVETWCEARRFEYRGAQATGAESR